ncbi:hypothetical protein E2320_010514 [Naja naja]|nr:hypothetical protein E2320_010514 [Naja naja]
MFVSLPRNSLGSITCRKWHASESFPLLLHDFTHCISLHPVPTKCVQGIKWAEGSEKQSCCSENKRFSYCLDSRTSSGSRKIIDCPEMISSHETI